jgi:hypothetical protein
MPDVTAKSPLTRAPNAPSISVPLRFVVTGLSSLVLAAVLLVLRPELLTTYHYNQHIVALTHLIVLGWATSIVMGAVYQLVPVALETRLYSERLARWQFTFHLVGFAGMVWMFWGWNMKHVGHFGSVFAVGMALYVYNVVRTLARVPRWNVIATAIASSVFWLTLTVLIGLSVAAGKCIYEYETPASQIGAVRAMLRGLQSLGAFMGRFDQVGAMHAHAHLGILGCFLMLIVGVSYRLIPMFAISQLQNPRRASWSVWLLNGGLAGAFVCVLLRSPWKPLFGAVITAALVLYALEVRAMLKARHRQTLDGPVRQFLGALWLLVPVVMLGGVLAWPGLPLTPFTGQLETLYAYLAVLGVVSGAILAMLYKIVPFLVWFGRYSTLIGRQKVPTLAEMYSARLQIAGAWLHLVAMVITGAGIVRANGACVRVGSVVLCASLAVFVWNMASVFRHLLKPRTEIPLAPSPREVHA